MTFFKTLFQEFSRTLGSFLSIVLYTIIVLGVFYGVIQIVSVIVGLGGA